MKRVAALSLAALALVAAGCGGGDDSSKEDYEKQVKEAGETLEKTFSDLGSSISASGSTEEAATKLEEGADALDEAAQDLDDIDPPSEIEGAHEDIVEGLEELGEEFRAGAEAAKGGDLSELLEFAQNLQGSDAVKKITAAGEKIEDEGYDFDAN